MLVHKYTPLRNSNLPCCQNVLELSQSPVQIRNHNLEVVRRSTNVRDIRTGVHRTGTARVIYFHTNTAIKDSSIEIGRITNLEKKTTVLRSSDDGVDDRILYSYLEMSGDRKRQADLSQIRCL